MKPTNFAVTELAAESSSGTNYLPLLLIAGLFLLTYFMIIRPQSKRRRAMVDMQSSLAAGVEVVTIGGLYGTVVGTDAETVDLQIAPNVNVTYARSAIARAVSPAQDFGDKEATDTDEADLDPVVDGTAASDAATKENIAKTQTATNPKS